MFIQVFFKNPNPVIMLGKLAVLSVWCEVVTFQQDTGVSTELVRAVCLAPTAMQRAVSSERIHRALPSPLLMTLACKHLAFRLGDGIWHSANTYVIFTTFLVKFYWFYEHGRLLCLTDSLVHLLGSTCMYSHQQRREKEKREEEIFTFQCTSIFCQGPGFHFYSEEKS